MTNTNCLEGIECPNCAQTSRFNITATIMCAVTDDGSDPVGDHDWHDRSFTRCPTCGYEGKLTEFQAKRNLPPDPERMNDNRAVWAGQALTAFINATGADKMDALADLLSDLMHWCDRNQMSFAAQLARAEWNYEAETGDEE